MDTHELLPTRTERLSFPSRHPTVMQRMRLIKDALAHNSSDSSREKNSSNWPSWYSPLANRFDRKWFNLEWMLTDSKVDGAALI